jgi:hypothetical protein
VHSVLRRVAVGFVSALVVAAPASASERRTPSLPTLLARYLPILVLHPAERFAPVPVDGFLADSDLQQKEPAGWVTIPGPLPAGGADLRLDQRSCQAIEGLAASPCYAQSEAAHAATPVVYGAAFRRGRRIDLQYWFWYPYDDYPATVPPGELWQVHEGDWESVSLVLDDAGAPLVAAYSQHAKGKRRAWSRVPKSGSRPLVYVGLGSHANFFGPGEQPLDPRTVDPALIAILKAYGVAVPADHTGKGRVVRPRLVRVTATSPSWMAFAGAWGETGYLHAPGKEPIPVGVGPRGPAFHAQWRRPVAEALSWPRG